MAKKEANIVVRLRDQASSGFKRLGQNIAGLAKPIGLVTGLLTGLSTLLGARFLRSAIQEAGEFGEQLSILGGLTRASADELRELETAARDAGATTRFTAAEAGQGLEELARGGQSVKDSIATLNPVLDLAAGNNQSVAESAQQVITTLNQFDLAASESGRVADVFTRGAQSSAQSVRELAGALSQAGPLAKQANLDIETTTAVIGKLADVGFRGERGGTALKNALIQLSDPTSKFRRELDALGIESTNFVEVLAELEKRGDDANAAILALGRQASPAIQALVSSGTAGIRELTGDLHDIDGASRDAAQAMEDNLPGALRALNSALSDAKIELTKDLTDELTGSVQDLAEGIRNFTKSDTMAALKGLLVDTFQTARQTVEDFVKSVDFDEVSNKIRELADTAREKIAEFSTSVEGFAAGTRKTIGALQVAAGTISAVWNAAGVAVSLLVEQVAHEIEGLLRLWGRFGIGFRKAAREMADEIKLVRDSFKESAEGFAEGVNNAVDNISDGWDRLTETTREKSRETAAAIDEEITESADKADDSLNQLKLQLLEAGLTAEQLGMTTDGLDESLGRAADSADDLGDSVAAAGEKARQTAEYFGTVDGEVVKLEGAAKDAAAAQKDAADSTEEMGEAVRRVGRRFRETGAYIEMGAEAQAEFNARLQEWKGGGTASYANHFKRALESAHVVQERVTAEQSRLNSLMGAGVSVTNNFAEANRNLKHELMELRGETEALVREREREERQALDAQLKLAQLAGDDERVKEIREYMRLQQDIAREEERQARQRKQDRDEERREIEELSGIERGSTTREQRHEINITLQSAVGRNGEREFSQADIQAIGERAADVVLNIIQRDGTRA